MFGKRLENAIKKTETEQLLETANAAKQIAELLETTTTQAKRMAASLNKLIERAEAIEKRLAKRGLE